MNLGESDCIKKKNIICFPLILELKSNRNGGKGEKWGEKNILHAEERVRLKRGSTSTLLLLTVTGQLMKQNPLLI